MSMVINTVLNMYLEKGTHDWLISTNTSWKLSKVGFLTKKRGGKINNSSKGFKELLMAKTKGSAIKDPISIKKKILKKSPTPE